MCLNNHKTPDFDTYLEMLKSAAHREDESRTLSSNPKHRLSQHVLNYDYVDHGEDMFVDAWGTTTPSYTNNNHEIVFDDNFDDTLQLLQHQTVIAKSNDNRRKEDRPHIPAELWNQLPSEARLWYLGQV